jgi:heterodisulfide reductase subunit A
VFLAGCAQSPKDIPDSVAQAKAAASSAAALMLTGKVRIEPLTVSIDESLCVGCELCAQLCPYGAPELIQTEEGRTRARIIEALCHGCGTCAASCPQNAITAKQFTDDQICSELVAALSPTGPMRPAKKKAEVEA